MTPVARKTVHVSKMVSCVMDALMSMSVFGVICSGRNEFSVAHLMHGELLRSFHCLHRELDPGSPQEIIAGKARECLLWEGNIIMIPPLPGKLSTRFDPSTRGLTDDHENDL
jgi:hypothetical protein